MPNGRLIFVLVPAAVVVSALPLALEPTRYVAALLNEALFYAIVVVSLNVILGLAGQVSLGQAGFVAVGAYAYALLTKDAASLPIVALIGGILAGGIAGLALGLPTLRMRGAYVVLGTMAFGEIVRLSLASGSWAGGVDGLVSIPTFRIGALDHGRAMYLLLLIALVASIALGKWLARSYLGKVLLAIKDDEIAAHAAGIDVDAAKLTAFALSGLIAGLAGALYSATYSVISPDVFDINLSLLVLTMLILGGMGRTSGAVMGAILLVALPEILRFSANVYMIIYAMMVVLLAIFLPNGVVGFAISLWPRLTVR